MNLFKLVVKEAWQRRWRLLASVIALILATGLMVTILSLNASSKQAVHAYMKNLGSNMIVIPADLDLFAYYSANPERLSTANMPESHFFRLLEAKIEGIEGIDPRLTIPIEVNGARALLTGILPDKMLRPDAKEGGIEDPWNVFSLLAPHSNNAVIGAEVKEILNIEAISPIGVLGRETKVLGILPRQGTIDDLRIYVHLRSLQKWLKRPLSLSEIRILYTGRMVIEKVASSIEGILESTRVVTHHRMAKKQIQVMESIRKYALALVVVTLTLGCITIGNEMFHNAHERRREIGILTALGATARTILAVFMIKAVFLALIGGLLGYGIGTLGAVFLGPRFLNVHVYPSLSLIPLAVLMAVGFSLASSMAPSWLASRMSPGEILQET